MERARYGAGLNHGTITISVSKKTENLPISAAIPGHYTVVSDCFRHGGPSSYFLL